MNLIYNSEQYSVVEFGAARSLEALRFGDYEIVVEEIEGFLGNYKALLSQPVLLH